jgi:hypothetical protein
MRNFAGAWRSPLLSLEQTTSNGKRTIMTVSLQMAEESPRRIKNYRTPPETSRPNRGRRICEPLDRATREHRIVAADKALQVLAARIGAPRSRLNSLEQVSAAAQKILTNKQVGRFLEAEALLLEEQSLTQASRGRPSPRTAYFRHNHQRPVLHRHSDAQALLEAARTRGSSLSSRTIKRSP